ncbi:hypothetical protein, partial [Streptomyces sp. NPDC058297]|uniref:hypothetical protein n=1 Tax=Streptomyces sp. NPDC058297 TaxID=3346433 RepID=UPI0036E47613
GDLGREPVYQELHRFVQAANLQATPSGWKGLTDGAGMFVDQVHLPAPAGTGLVASGGSELLLLFAVVVMRFRLRNPWLPGKNRRVYVDKQMGCL